MLRLLLLAVLTAGTIAHSPLLATPAVDAADEARPNRLASLVAEDVSPTELRVFAHYVYNGARGTDDIVVTASAVQRSGSFVPGLVNDVTGAVVRPGTGRAVTVLRMESPGPPVRSTQVEVCLNHRFSGDIFCSRFPHLRLWRHSASPPSQPGTCTITGEISGQLRWTVNANRGGHRVSQTAELREMVMTSRDGARFTAPLKGRQYVFSDIPAGTTYRIVPGRSFRAEPRERTVDCRRNFIIRNADFTITGSPFGD